MADVSASKKLELKIISPGQKIHKRIPTMADMVIMRCTTGDLGVLPGRAPCSVVLGEGEMRILNEGKEINVKIGGGVANVSHDVVTVLSEIVEYVG